MIRHSKTVVRLLLPTPVGGRERLPELQPGGSSHGRVLCHGSVSSVGPSSAARADTHVDTRWDARPKLIWQNHPIPRSDGRRVASPSKVKERGCFSRRSACAFPSSIHQERISAEFSCAFKARAGYRQLGAARIGTETIPWPTICSRTTL